MNHYLSYNSLLLQSRARSHSQSNCMHPVEEPPVQAMEECQYSYAGLLPIVEIFIDDISKYLYSRESEVAYTYATL
jgi:hypothetical protein